MVSSSGDERQSLSLLRKISNTVWKRDMVFERKSNFTENGESYGERNVQSESCRQEDDRRT